MKRFERAAESLRMRRIFLFALVVLASATVAAPADARWRPAVGIEWQWQLSGRLDLSVDVPVYDVDGFETRARTVERLHSLGRRAVCYISAGSWEEWRPDADRFPAEVIGRRLDGWPGERWLDIRRLGLLEPIMRDRIAMCARKGFDAVEPDNIDGYANESGFPLTGADQLRYNRRLARLAHEEGLSIALKNDPGHVDELVSRYDFAIVEQCFQYRECGRFTAFVDAGKPVFETEYSLPRSEFCAKAHELGFSAMKKRFSLGAWRRPC
jgi:hypothetical protein